MGQINLCMWHILVDERSISPPASKMGRFPGGFQTGTSLFSVKEKKVVYLFYKLNYIFRSICLIKKQSMTGKYTNT